MIAVEPDLLRRLVAEARLAPSVHNIQPTRVSLDAGAILLQDDPARRLPAADPTGHDVRLSHGAFLEGLALALGRAGLAIAELTVAPTGAAGPIARIAAAAGTQDPSASPDPLASHVAARASWRGGFTPADDTTRAALARLAGNQSDLLMVTEPQAVRRIAMLADRAGLFFLRDQAHRRELTHWMRLSRAHPDHDRDGLNAEAMALGRIEAFGAGLVLGPLFPLLDRLGLAGPVTAEAGKAGSAAAMALFHRAEGEDPLVTGRAFYRAWLAGCPVSVLADWPEANAALRAAHPLPAGRRLVNVFRIGVPARPRRIGHARLPVEALIRPAS
ncbi:hypothetical protein [Phreatobacter stygius]|uniref:Nitroreductase n=1 Tax=Phreatobacter stygius TaxID=1940610 RepID=A0A4D7B0I3_9HYPH|nr:hypothetical protein [Phreatobacter stygius]QCI62936.1 hypothetical protein E8M01_00950 [Phreatobacter stygius]